MKHQALLQRAVACHQRGLIDDALGLYQQLLAAGCREIPLLVNCAAALRAKERTADAIKMLTRATELAPEAAEVWFNLGNAHQAARALVQSEQAFLRALEIRPRFFAAHFNLARLLAEQGRLDEAASRYRDAIDIEPAHARSWSNLGNVERRRERSEEAQRCHREAVRIEPDNADFWLNFGNAWRDSQRTAEAADAYRTALDLRPRFEAAMEQLIELNPGNADWRQELSQTFSDSPLFALCMARWYASRGDVESAMRTLDDGVERFPDDALLRTQRGRERVRRQQLDIAIVDLEHAVRCSDRVVDAWCALGIALHQRGQVERAHQAFDQALAIDPRNVELLANLGLALSRDRRIADAMEVLRRAVALQPDHPQALQQLAVVLIDVGHSVEAEKTARRLFDLTSGAVSARRILAHALVQQGLVYEAQEVMAEKIAETDVQDLDLHNAAFTSLYDDRQSARSWFELHCETGARISVASSAAPLSTGIGKRIRIGYMSPDFRDHPVGYLISPVLKNHDRVRVEIFAYHDAPSSDEVTHGIREHVENWRDIRGLHHDQVLDRVRSDGLDLLVDLGGHTSGSRLPVLRGRAAPIQVSWLGYPATTGVPEVDYLVADRVLAPEPLQACYSERVVSLDTFAFGWARDPRAPRPRNAPHENLGTVTFGCWNNIAKWSPRAIRLWSRVLLAVPASRLNLRASALADAENCRAVRARFAEHGVDPERIETHGPLRPIRDYLDAFGSVDILLDPVPYNGGATTLGALWQGVPVVTLAGDFFMERMGASMLQHLDLPELIAHSDDEYVDIARRLAADPERISALRTELPQRITRQRLAGAAAFTWHVERIWRHLVGHG